MQSILTVAVRELRRLASKPVYWLCLIAGPLFCLIFFTTMMREGLPERMPLGLVDEDNTSTSRSIARNLNAFQMSSIEENYASVSEARSAVQRGDVYGFYYIPKGTTAKAQRQEMPTVSFYTNYTYLVAGSLIYRDMRTMSELASGAAGRTVLYARGATTQQAMAFLQPVVIDTHAVGNPWLNYNIYLSNTIVPGLLSLFIFLLTVASIGAEMKHGTAEAWLKLANGSMLRALAGKLLPQTLIFLLLGGTYVVALYGVLHFPCNCGIGTMFLVMALGVLASQGLGVFMFTALPSLRLALSFASLWGVVSFSISGMSYPVMAMHPTLQALSYLFPLRHYFLLYVNCALDGYPLMNAWPYVGGLLCFALLPLLCLGRLKRSLLTVVYEP